MIVNETELKNMHVNNRNINKEKRRLQRLFASIPKNEYQLLDPLLSRCAFLKVLLEDLEDSIKKGEMKIQNYNSTLKQYNVIIQKLRDMLPEEKEKSKLDAFINE